MAPIAKIFHNLPELSDDFRRLLKDLMDSAPDETTSTQVRVAADLTDTPYDEGLRRMAEYADALPSKNSYGDNEYFYGRAATNLNKTQSKKLRERLERELKPDERVRMEEELAASPDKTFLAPRLYSLGFLNDAINRNNYSIDARKLWLDNAARGRKEAQRRMALEYLLEGLL